MEFTVEPESYLASTHVKVAALEAKLDAVLDNQARILAALTGKGLQETKEEIAETLAEKAAEAEKEYYNWLAKNTI